MIIFDLVLQGQLNQKSVDQRWARKIFWGIQKIFWGTKGYRKIFLILYSAKKFFRGLTLRLWRQKVQDHLGVHTPTPVPTSAVDGGLDCPVGQKPKLEGRGGLGSPNSHGNLFLSSSFEGVGSSTHFLFSSGFIQYTGDCKLCWFGLYNKKFAGNIGFDVPPATLTTASPAQMAAHRKLKQMSFGKNIFIILNVQNAVESSTMH